MYFYKFESKDFEEQYSFELTHTKKFTSEELDKMVIKAIKTYIKEDYTSYLSSPCNLRISDLFFNESLQDTLVRLFGFKKIIYESKIEYNGELLFRDDSRHKNNDFKKRLKNLKVPECYNCSNETCLIENPRF